MQNMALNKNFDPIAGLFNNIEHIKPESSTDKTSKSTEASDSTKEEKQAAVTESSKEEKQAAVTESSNEEKAEPVKDEKQETAKSSKDEKQETTSELTKNESDVTNKTSEDKMKHEANEKDSADTTLKNPDENNNKETSSKPDEPKLEQENKSEKETNLFNSVKKADLIPGDALSDLDFTLVTNGTTIPKEQKRWLERTAIKKGISREQYIAQILANEYQVKTKVNEYFADIFVENFNKANKSNVRFNYRIPAYLNEYLAEAASENGMKKNVMLSYFINEEQKHEHQINRPIKAIDENQSDDYDE
jgi:hypothetical protein